MSCERARPAPRKWKTNGAASDSGHLGMASLCSRMPLADDGAASLCLAACFENDLPQASTTPLLPEALTHGPPPPPCMHTRSAITSLAPRDASSTTPPRRNGRSTSPTRLSRAGHLDGTVVGPILGPGCALLLGTHAGKQGAARLREGSQQYRVRTSSTQDHANAFKQHDPLRSDSRLLSSRAQLSKTASANRICARCLHDSLMLQHAKLYHLPGQPASQQTRPTHTISRAHASPIPPLV